MSTHKPKVLTDDSLIDEFLERGVEKIFPSKEALREKLKSGQRITAYQGFDPTGPYLHVGHAMGIRALGILQKLGHEVVFLVGDYTARVGDPDKATTRKLLTEEEIETNMKGWKEQAAQLIDFGGENPVLFKHNHEWLSKLTLAELIKLMSQATVQQMLERELFQKRMNEQQPIGLQEFIYPLMQGYDSVAMNVDLEIGGTDQTFNMLVGRQLVKNYLNKEKFVRTNVMMDAPDGLTMSKTKGNGINLSDTAENMYGKAMSYPDQLITKAMRLLTNIPLKDIDNVEKQIAAGENPMTFKKLMAFEVVTMIKGKEQAQKGQLHFEKTVQNKEISEDQMTQTSTKGTLPLVEFLKANLKDKSVGEIKRVIEQGGVEVNNTQKTNPFEEVEFKSGCIVKFGKRTYFKVK